MLGVIANRKHPYYLSLLPKLLRIRKDKLGIYYNNSRYLPNLSELSNLELLEMPNLSEFSNLKILSLIEKLFELISQNNTFKVRYLSRCTKYRYLYVFLCLTVSLVSKYIFNFCFAYHLINSEGNFEMLMTNLSSLLLAKW